MRVTKQIGMLLRSIAFGLVLAALVGGCGATTPTTFAVPTTINLPPAVQDDIAANWVTFFDGTQAIADRIGLLENGQQYAQQLDAFAGSPAGSTLSVSMSSVTVTSPTTAEVKYSLLEGGKMVLPGQVGKAVLQDGVWKVGAESFLAVLAQLEGSTTPAS